MDKPKKVFLWRPVSDTVKVSNHTRDFRVPFTLKYIQAELTRNTAIKVKLIDSFVSSLTYAEIIDFTLHWKPDIIAILLTTTEYCLCLDYAKKVKDKVPAYIIALGQDPSFSPERYVNETSNVDAVLIGESEQAFVALAEFKSNNLRNNQIKGCYTLFRKDCSVNLVKNLDALPDILYSKQELKKYNLFYPLNFSKKVVWGQVLTSRGCPYECIFCSQTIRESYGKVLRFHGPKRVLKEIKNLRSLGVNVFSFADDNFTTSVFHVNAVCNEIINSGLDIRWTAHARIDNLNQGLMRKMKKAGCVQLRFGIETGSEKVLKTLKKTAIGKDWFVEARYIFKIAKDLNIDTVAMFLVGSPGETLDDIKKSIKFALSLDSDFLQLCFFTPYPGSEAYRIFKEQIKSAYLKRMYHYSSPAVNLSRIEQGDLLKIYSFFYRKFYLRPLYLFKHILKYGIYYLNNPFFLLKVVKTLKVILRYRH